MSISLPAYYPGLRRLVFQARKVYKAREGVEPWRVYELKVRVMALEVAMIKRVVVLEISCDHSAIM